MFDVQSAITSFVRNLNGKPSFILMNEYKQLYSYARAMFSYLKYDKRLG